MRVNLNGNYVFEMFLGFQITEAELSRMVLLDSKASSC
jgi:hypothetical protein